MVQRSVKRSAVRVRWELEEYTLDMAYQEGERLGVPVILETDAMSKCEKYHHLGMELAGTRDVGAFGKLYDLIRYPEKPASKEVL